MEKLAEVFKINRRIALEYEAAATLMRDEEITKSLTFLLELDVLAEKYQFLPADIIQLLVPDYAVPGFVLGAPSPTNSVSTSASTSGRLKRSAGSAHSPDSSDLPSSARLKRQAEQHAKGQGGRKPKALKRYQNPYTGEVLETESVNHKLLKKWKADHGADQVETWQV
jgi:hypothetical protein